MRKNADAPSNSTRTLIEDESLRRGFGEKIEQKNFEGTGEIRKFLEFLES